MTSNDTTYDLLSLLPNTPYTLAYALPLFFISVILTFAGCFLTLDRTRAFPSTGQAQGAPLQRSALSRLRSLYLGGGIGGLCAGYAFGGAQYDMKFCIITDIRVAVHFSTFLSVVLPNTTPTSPLGPKAFLAIWVVSTIFCLVLGGKWRYAAISLIGISGWLVVFLPTTLFSY